jgi:diguanylate cyclase (GGDEF)-like protein/PAS domain S-box-containing protein
VNLGNSDAPVALGGGALTGIVFARQILAAQVHGRMMAALAAARSEARFKSLVQKSSDALLVVAPGGTVSFSTPSADLLLGGGGDLVGRNILDSARAESRGLFQRLLTEARTADEGNLRQEVQVDEGTGSAIWLDLTATNLLGDENVRGIVLNGRDITARRALEDQLTRLALRDELTGLANRALFHDRVEAALRRSRRRRTGVTVLLLDLDNFKVVNDTLGHLAGDRLLALVAARITSATREEDTVARLGGDEFGVLIEGRETEDAGQELAERIRAALAAPMAVDAREVFVGASIGIASSARDSTVTSLIGDADLAMYAAKRREKGSRRVFEPALRDTMAAELELSTGLHQALERREFEVDYQPIMRLADGKITGAEALLRWRHPRHGLLAPLTFIPAAETSGLIMPIGAWVMEEACRTSRALAAASPPDLPFGMAVNLSVRQLRDPGLVADVERILEKTGLAPGLLTLEVVESLLVDDRALIERLARVRRFGVRIAIDDFGTGYSSLSYLGSLPVDILKVASEFVGRLETDPGSVSVLKAILELARGHGLQTVAEGIETPGQLAVLRDLGYTHGQGFFLGRPISQDAFTRFQAELAGRPPASETAHRQPSAA